MDASIPQYMRMYMRPKAQNQFPSPRNNNITTTGSRRAVGYANVSPGGQLNLGPVDIPLEGKMFYVSPPPIGDPLLTHAGEVVLNLTDESCLKESHQGGTSVLCYV